MQMDLAQMDPSLRWDDLNLVQEHFNFFGFNPVLASSPPQFNLTAHLKSSFQRRLESRGVAGIRTLLLSPQKTSQPVGGAVRTN
ncbi:MAG: hypothetical protein V4495_24660 [Pseudomonadota bacterium]